MHARHVITLALFVAAAPWARAQDTTVRSGVFIVGAGIGTGQGLGAGPAGQLGYEWRAPRSRFGIRLAAEYLGDPATTRPLYDWNANDLSPIGTERTTGGRFALSALTTFALSTGRVQPYLISGVMLQHERTDLRVTLTDPATAPFAIGDGGRESTYKRRDFSLGFQGGLGVRARVGRSWLYTEIRGHSTGDAWLRNRNATPITFGIQFE